MEKILVTGGAGFIGSHIVGSLKQDYDVRVLDNLFSGKREHVPAGIEFIEGDITNRDDVRRAMQGIDRVIHLAALRSVPASWDAPDDYKRVNEGGTDMVCEQALLAGVRRMVSISSSSVYGIAPQPLREGSEAEEAQSPYARTKRKAEKICIEYAEKGLDVVSLRYFNVFGPRQDPHGNYATFIAGTILKLNKGEPVVINEDGAQTRDFNPVANTAHGSKLALFSPKKFRGEPINIASGTPHTVNQTFEIIQRSIARYNPKVLDSRPVRTNIVRKGDIRDNAADLTTARQLLGYTPVETFEEGIDKTVDYFCK